MAGHTLHDSLTSFLLLFFPDGPELDRSRAATMTISSRLRNKACLSTMELLIPLVVNLRNPPGNILVEWILRGSFFFLFGLGGGLIICNELLVLSNLQTNKKFLNMSG